MQGTAVVEVTASMTALHLGDRVRIKLVSKPDALDLHKGDRFGCGGQVVGHRVEQDGREGVIADCGNGFPCKDGSKIDHGYLVAYDLGYGKDGDFWWGGHFDEAELTPVPTAAQSETENPAR